MSEDLTGRMLGPYEIVDQIGQGGMATVYRAVQSSMDRHVAIKVLPRAFAHDPTFVGRFQQEAKVIARLEHARILPVYDYGEQDGITYIVMRYLNAGTLSERIDQGPVPLGETSRIISQIAEGLDYAHKRGVFHRDIKPSNILLDESGDAYITDFGIARLAESSGQFTGSGIVGTPTYISPEQAMGHPVDGRTDIYSLGVVLYQMVTGDVPYQAETPMGVVIKHINDPLPLPRTLMPTLPANVEAVILQALAKTPDARYQTAGDLAQALRDAVLHPTAPAPFVPPAIRSRLPPLAHVESQTMPMAPAAADAVTTAGPGPTQPPMGTSVPAQPAKKNASGCLIALGVGGTLITLCLVVGGLLALRNRAMSNFRTPEPTATSPLVVAEATSPLDVPSGGGIAPGGAETCPSGTILIQHYEGEAVPDGLSTGNPHLITTDQGESVLVLEPGAGESVQFFFPPRLADVSLSMVFMIPSGPTVVGLIARYDGEDLGYGVVIFEDGRVEIVRNDQTVDSSEVDADSIMDGSAHELSLHVIGGTVTAHVDGAEVATYEDPDPLPSGLSGYGAVGPEIWIDWLTVCGTFTAGEPAFVADFDQAELDPNLKWLNEPGEGHWALEDGRLRLDAMPGTARGSNNTPALLIDIPQAANAYTAEVTLHIDPASTTGAGIALVSRANEIIASLIYGVRSSADGDVEGVFFDQWEAAEQQGDAYHAHLSGAGFLVNDVMLRLVMNRGEVTGYYSYDAGTTWEPAGVWAVLEARIDQVALITAGGEASETIPVYFDDFRIFAGALEP